MTVFPKKNPFTKFEFLLYQVQFQDGKECIAIRELYNLLKDHKNPYMQDLVTASYEHNYREELSSLLATSQPQELEGCGTKFRSCHYREPKFSTAIIKRCRKDDGS